MGLVAEALVYYDRIIVALATPQEFKEFVRWFANQGKIADLVRMLRDGSIAFYYYAFASAPVLHEGRYTLMNIQDQEAADRPVFESRVLAYSNLADVLPHARQRSRLLSAIQGQVTEVKATEFGAAIENAREDFRRPERCAWILQALVDEVYPQFGLGPVPTITATVDESGGSIVTRFNLDFAQLSQNLGSSLNFHAATPLSGAVMCNKLLWSSARMDSDIYLHAPISGLVGKKLEESSQHRDRPAEIIDQLVAQVEFPDVRVLVNSGQIGLAEVLDLRGHGSRFRRWLQQEGERDRNALIAYHTETAREAGWVHGGRKTLRLFGLLGGAALGGYLGEQWVGPTGAAGGAMAGAGVNYLLDLGSRLRGNWRPVVFGEWAGRRLDDRASPGGV